MISKSKTLVASKQCTSDYTIMENILKDLYKNVDEKLSCACLVHKDMKAIVMNYILQQKPWLVKSESEKQADILLRNCYDEYRREKEAKKVNVFRRSLKKVINKEPPQSCGCGWNLINRAPPKPPRQSKTASGYKQMDNDVCRCHITCSTQTNPTILKPLEKFVSVNRSFMLRLKHLDQEKYGYLNTEVPEKAARSQESIIDSRPATPNKSFQVKMEDASTPSKANKYQFLFTKKPSTASEEGKSTKVTAATRSLSKEKIKNLPSRKEHTFTKEPPTVSKPKKPEEDEKIVVKLTHCDNHCFLCLLETGVREEAQLVYCSNHCPKCVLPLEQEVANNAKAINNIIKPKLAEIVRPRPRTKSEGRSIRKPKKLPVSPDVSALLDDDFKKTIKKKKGTKIYNKENLSKFQAEDEIAIMESNSEECNINLNDFLEWDSAGFDQVEGNSNSYTRVNVKWGNTAKVLDNIKNNHIKPIKQDLRDMQKYFRSLTSKYKL